MDEFWLICVVGMVETRASSPHFDLSAAREEGDWWLGDQEQLVHDLIAAGNLVAAEIPTYYQIENKAGDVVCDSRNP